MQINWYNLNGRYCQNDINLMNLFPSEIEFDRTILFRLEIYDRLLSTLLLPFRNIRLHIYLFIFYFLN